MRGMCEACGASDAECDDSDYMRNTPCCEQCHHAYHHSSATWTSMSRSAPYAQTIVAAAQWDDPESFEEEDE